MSDGNFLFGNADGNTFICALAGKKGELLASRLIRELNGANNHPGEITQIIPVSNTSDQYMIASTNGVALVKINGVQIGVMQRVWSQGRSVSSILEIGDFTFLLGYSHLPMLSIIGKGEVSI